MTLYDDMMRDLPEKGLAIQRYRAGYEAAFKPAETPALDSPTLDVQRIDREYPCDAKPYNDFAALFGAAGTVMAAFQMAGKYTATKEQIQDRVMAYFIPRGAGFCNQVMSIILGYYSGRNERPQWDAAVRAHLQALEHGQQSSGPNEHRPNEHMENT